MLSNVLVKRLTFIESTLAKFIPPDADVIGFVVANEAGKFEFEVSMNESVDMALKYRAVLSDALTAAGVPWTCLERGRRESDASGEYIFDTEHFVIKAVNFSQFITNLGLTTEGPKDSGDPEIEAFIAESEKPTTPVE